MTTHQNGHAPGKRDMAVAERQALADIIERQSQVLEELRAPIPRARLLSWKAEVIQAAVGHVDTGLLAVLGDPDMAALLDPYLTGEMPDPELCETARGLLHQSIGNEFAMSLREMSRISQEELSRAAGIGQGALHVPARTPTYR